MTYTSRLRLVVFVAAAESWYHWAQQFHQE